MTSARAEEALARARELASDRDVTVMGGGTVVGALLREGLDESKIHLVPVIFGRGTRLFDEVGSEHVHLEPLEVEQRPRATHLRYRVAVRDGSKSA